MLKLNPQTILLSLDHRFLQLSSQSLLLVASQHFRHVKLIKLLFRKTKLLFRRAQENLATQTNFDQSKKLRFRYQHSTVYLKLSNSRL